MTKVDISDQDEFISKLHTKITTDQWYKKNLNTKILDEMHIAYNSQSDEDIKKTLAKEMIQEVLRQVALVNDKIYPSITCQDLTALGLLVGILMLIPNLLFESLVLWAPFINPDPLGLLVAIELLPFVLLLGPVVLLWNSQVALNKCADLLEDIVNYEKKDTYINILKTGANGNPDPHIQMVFYPADKCQHLRINSADDNNACLEMTLSKH